jgi:Domain of unknown function (DUF2341)/Cadherin-like beta sandwich domain/Divergent InlB B-repeat domain
MMEFTKRLHIFRRKSEQIIKGGVMKLKKAGALALSMGLAAFLIFSSSVLIVQPLRAANPSTDATLNNLAVSSGALNPGFGSAVTSYTDNVAYNIPSITVTPTTNDSNATVTVNTAAVTSGSPSSAISLNTGPNAITVVVTAQDTVTQKTYNINVIVAAPTTTKAITAFNFASPAATGVVTESTHQVAVTVPFGTNVTALVPTITITGASVSPNSGVAQDFTHPVTYTVTAQDNSTQPYTVTVTIANPSQSAEITAFSIPSETGPASINSPAGTIGVTVPYNTDVTALVATFATSASVFAVKVGATAQVSGATPNNFTNPVIYAVTAQDITVTKNWTVTVTVAPKSSDATLKTLSLSSGSLNPGFDSNTTAYAANVDPSVASVTVTPTTNQGDATLTVNGTAVVSGATSTPITLNIGTNTITIIVTAQNGTSTKTYTVTVIKGYTLTVNISGSSASGPGGSVVANPSQTGYAAAAPVTLTATATNGWTFTGWTDSVPADISSTTANPATVTMNHNETVIATFTQNIYTLTVNVTGNGTVNQTILPGSGSSPASGQYTSWTEVQLSAVPAAGWTFTGWGGSLTGINPSNSTIMSINLTITATFQIVPVVSTGASATGPNSVTLTGTLTGFGGSNAPRTSAQAAFEWGTGTDYGSITPLQLKTSTGDYTAIISGIAAGTYHYRAMAVGDGTGYGNDSTFTIAATTPTSGWWNSSWNSRSEVDITGTGTALADYQISLSVPYNNKMQANFGDIRFVAADNSSVLSYWMTNESASTSATFWIKVPAIAASGTTKIYMYYGDSSAATASNIHTTFIFGDDFADPTFTYAHIHAFIGGASSQGVVVENGVPVYEMSGDNTTTNTGDRAEPIAEIYNNGSLMSFPANYIAEDAVESFVQNGSVFFNARYLDVNWKYEQLIDFQFNQVVENKVVNTVWTNLGITTGVPTAINTWYPFKSVVLANGNNTILKTYVNGAQIGPDVTDSSLPYPTYSGLAFLNFSVNGPFHGGFKDFRVRQYAATEPSAVLGTAVGIPTQVKVETAADGSGSVVAAQNLVSGAAITVYAVARDASNNFIANVPGTWSLTGTTGGVTGTDLVPSTDTMSAVFTGHSVGTAKIHVVSNSLTSTDSGTITVTASQIRVETAADGSGTVVPAQSLVSGFSVTVYAVSRDAAGNFVANISGTWSLTNILGGVAAGDLIPASDGKSAVFTGHVIGSAGIHVASAPLTSTDSGKITVTVGSSAAQIKVETAADGSGSVVAAQSIASGASITVYAVSCDASGNFIANIAGTWSLTGVLGGVVPGDIVPSSDSKSAVFTGHIAGSANIHVASGSLISTDSGKITVTAGGTVAKIQVETAADGSGAVVGAQNLASGSSITVYAISRDASNNFIANVAGNWSLNTTGGVVSGDLLPSSDTKSAAFNAHAVGTAVIQVISSSLTGTSGTITVTANQVKVETAANGSGTVVSAQNLASGASITVYAVSRDAAGNFVANVSGTWSLTGILGGVLPGDIVPASDGKSAVFTSHVIGSATIHIVSGTLTGTDSGKITVIAGNAALVKVETAADGSGTVVAAQNVSSGSFITVYAVSRDAAGNFVANVAGAWSLTVKTGGVANTDLTPSGDTKSAVFTGHLVGSAYIHVISGALTVTDSGKITVIAGGTATQVRVETAANGSGTVVAAQSISSGSSITVYAVSRDATGNFIANVAGAWSLSVKTGGVANTDLTTSVDTKSAVFTANSTGTAAIRVTVSGLTSVDSGLLTVTAAVSGGGGGGGGGGVAGTPVVSGITNVTSYINAQGVFSQNINAWSDDTNVLVQIPTGTKVLAANGALPTEIDIIHMVTPPAFPAGAGIIGLAYDCTPAGITFSPAVTIRFNYNPTLIPAGMLESNLQIAYFDTTQNAWVTVPATVDTVNHYISAQISHFTAYGVTYGVKPVTPAPTTTTSTTTTTTSTPVVIPPVSTTTTTTPVTTATTTPVVTTTTPSVTTTVPPVTTTAPVISTNTGTFTSADGNAMVTIPAGCTGQTASGQSVTAVTVTPVNNPPAPSANADSLGLYYEFGPTGATFSSPVTITLKYNPSTLPAGTDQSKLYLAYWDAGNNRWVSVPSVVDQANHTITASVEHFTLYSAMAAVTTTNGLSPWVIAAIVVVSLIIIGFGAWMIIYRRRKTA